MFEPFRDSDTGLKISFNLAATLYIKPRSKLSESQAKKVEALIYGHAAFATMRALAIPFNGIFRSNNSCLVKDWIDQAAELELVEIMLFARFLHRDIDAVKNAIELRWSNGQVEGEINRV